MEHYSKEANELNGRLNISNDQPFETTSKKSTDHTTQLHQFLSCEETSNEEFDRKSESNGSCKTFDGSDEDDASATESLTEKKLTTDLEERRSDDSWVEANLCSDSNQSLTEQAAAAQSSIAPHEYFPVMFSKMNQLFHSTVKNMTKCHFKDELQELKEAYAEYNNIQDQVSDLISSYLQTSETANNELRALKDKTVYFQNMQELRDKEDYISELLRGYEIFYLLDNPCVTEIRETTKQMAEYHNKTALACESYLNELFDILRSNHSPDKKERSFHIQKGGRK